MSLRTSSAALFALASACGPVVQEEDGATIPCALHGATALAEKCTLRAAGTGGGWIVTVRHPDGGFRRFDVTGDRRVAAADGAEIASGRPMPDGRLEVTIGADRYQLPASFQ